MHCDRFCIVAWIILLLFFFLPENHLLLFRLSSPEFSPMKNAGLKWYGILREKPGRIMDMI